MSDQKESFPVIPAKHWWKLREQFKQTIPAQVTTSYIASVLDMKEISARTNIITPMISFGIIDSDFKPKERAKKWRDDETYAEVCKEIMDEIYPRELIDACPPSNPDRDSVYRWFAYHTGGGKSVVNKMSATYLLLCEADPQKTQSIKNKLNRELTKKTKKVNNSTKVNSAKDNGPRIMPPSIHIDIQLHISPDISPELIEKIFESMEKHIYKIKE